MDPMYPPHTGVGSATIFPFSNVGHGGHNFAWLPHFGLLISLLPSLDYASYTNNYKLGYLIQAWVGGQRYGHCLRLRREFLLTPRFILHRTLLGFRLNMTTIAHQTRTTPLLMQQPWPRSLRLLCHRSPKEHCLCVRRSQTFRMGCLSPGTQASRESPTQTQVTLRFGSRRQWRPMALR
jgi:hypothetical protein